MPPRRSGNGSPPMPDLAALVTRRHDALRANVIGAYAGKVDGVHQARVASRRLREVVPVLGHGLDDERLKALRKDLRAVTRALGPVRELDVAAGMIEDLVLDHADGDRLRKTWLAQIERQRHGPVRALHKALAPRRRDKLDQELEAFAAERRASSNQDWRDALAQRLTERARGLRARVARTGTLYRPEPLHDVRIATKKLRYALEMTAETGLMRLARPLRTLKAAQESLGQLHDLDVLFTSLYAVPGAAPGDPFQHAAADVVTKLERQSRRLHARYLRTRTALERVTHLTLETVVPRVQVTDRPAGKP
jgi:CHAD domain-containing protein